MSAGKVQHEMRHSGQAHLVFGSGLDMRYEVAAIGHRVSHGLVQIGHADLESHASGESCRGTSHHVLPGCQALLHTSVTMLGLNALHTLLYVQSVMITIIIIMITTMIIIIITLILIMSIIKIIMMMMMMMMMMIMVIIFTCSSKCYVCVAQVRNSYVCGKVQSVTAAVVE